MIQKVSVIALLALIAFANAGCIPLLVGGGIGYWVEQTHEHDVWCSAHVTDPSCHP